MLYATTYYVMSKVLFGIIIIVFVIILGGVILPGVVDETASDEYSEPFSVVTGVGVTNTTETLSYASYYDDLTGLSATSDNVADTPVVMDYDPTSYEVVVGSLAASDSRILTVTYDREAGTQFYGFGPFLRFLPTLVIIGGVIAGIIAIYFGVKERR